MKTSMRIGVLSYRFNNYAYRRNILGIVNTTSYKTVKDVFAGLYVVARRINKITGREIFVTRDLKNQFYDLNLNKVDVLHFFNGISYGSRPWVSTFETVLPRFTEVLRMEQEPAAEAPEKMPGWKTRKALEALAGNSCKRIIALSECTANRQRNLLGSMSAYREDIEKKLVVMHPPQELIVPNFPAKGIDVKGKIRFMFVGKFFVRKGGLEILNTFQELRNKYRHDLELILVSKFSKDSSFDQDRQERAAEAMQMIQDNKDWIRYNPQLPNDEIITLMRRSHVGLLPTYTDSFGYSVLEFQAAGCPVITTNVRALPEINDNEKGWLIEIPKNHLGEAIHTTDGNQDLTSSLICQGLEKAIQQIYADRTIIEYKSERAIAGIREHHSTADHAARMEKIYLEAAGG